MAAFWAAASWAPGARAQEIDLLTWLGGPDRVVLDQLTEAFQVANPGMTVKINVVTSQGDMRGGMRTALLGGETPDLITNTWPAFRQELVDAGILREMNDVWSASGWDTSFSQTWRDLSAIDGTVYGIPYIFGYRSGIWHVPADLAKIGVSGFPGDYAGFLATFGPLRDAGFAEPIAMPAQTYAHAEWLESLLIRVGGPELLAQLGKHEIAWTDNRVATAMREYAKLFENRCCGDPQLMYATHWDTAADRIFVERKANYLLIGTWLNARAISQYKLEPGTGFDLGKFPALGLGHDDASVVDTKELLATNSGDNPEGANRFLDFVRSAEGANIVARNGFMAPSSAVDTSLYGPVLRKAAEFAGEGPVHFVLGDMLPGSLVDEYRLALQDFIAEPNEAKIMPTLERIEAAAASAY
jgi:multiple sugar transport system substrate-binding protein